MEPVNRVNLGVLLYPGVMMSAVHGLGELIQVAERIRSTHPDVVWPALEVSYWSSPRFSAPPAPVANVIGSNANSELGVILIPPSTSDSVPELQDEVVSDWLSTSHRRGCVLASACAGAFLLGETGLLDHRAVTTHWILAEELKKRYPNIRLQMDKMLVDDMDIVTAGGLMGWVDLGVHLLQRFTSPYLVMELSKFFIIDTGRREQRFYQSFSPRFNHGDGQMVQVQHWLQRHYAESPNLVDLAALVNLSSRSLQRRFAQATGLTPSVYLQELRLQKARELLETTRSNVEQIAFEIGYQDISAFRRRFSQKVGLSPSEYRKRFQTEEVVLE